MSDKIKNFSIFAGLAIVILWQMLLPGYILTLDMVFTPHIKYFFGAHDVVSSAPLFFLLKMSSYLIPGWVVQKIVLSALFFSLGYLAFRYLPVPDRHNARFVAAIFYAVNPFVYERMLAGQWTLLFAYALLPAAIHFFSLSMTNSSWRNTGKYFFLLFLISIFSVHVFVMAVLASAVFFIFSLFGLTTDRRLLSVSFVAGVIALVFACSYWLVPYLRNPSNSVIAGFDQSHVSAYRTAGSIGNVLGLYGFWGENYPWARYWLWPKDYPVSMLAGGILAAWIIMGTVQILKDDRRLAYPLIIVGAMSLMFSCGVGDSIFQGVNQYIFDHVGFWGGFRDSEKWSAVLAFVYAIILGRGVVWIGEVMKKKKMLYRELVFSLFVFVPFIYTPTMVGGFARQLQPVWYPNDWIKVNDILRTEAAGRNILFLPWHGYLSFDFNNRVIMANPARYFFDGDVVQSEIPEIGEAQTAPNFYDAGLQALITSDDSNSEDVVGALKIRKFGFIIFAHDLVGSDKFSYPFLLSDKLEKVKTYENLTVYRLN